MIWLSQRRLLQEPWIVQENHPDFPSHQLFATYLPMYFMEICISEPADFGVPILRTRKWCVLRHRVKTARWFTSPLATFVDMMKRVARADWRIFLWETNEDKLQAELDWASNRPSSRGGGRRVLLSEPDAWYNALSRSEFEFAQHYQELFPHEAWSLNQNPLVKPMSSNGQAGFLCMICFGF
jgi:hypothetical protein